MEECGAGKSLDGDDIACAATLILTFSGPAWKIGSCCLLRKLRWLMHRLCRDCH